MIDRQRYLELFVQDGALLRRAAARDLSAAVLSCPGWQVDDVVRHTAQVYEHKLACLALGGPAPDPWPPTAPWSSDSLAWYDDAHARLLELLRTTDPTTTSWTWNPEDQTAGFWLRRMALETAVHRVDVELAFGKPSAVDPELAVDGIDELLLLMVAGDWTDDAQPDLTGSVAVATAGRTWTVRMLEARVDVELTEAGDVATVVRADPSVLLLWLYGRAPDDVVTIAGGTAATLRNRIALATQ